MYCPKCGTENPDGVRFCGNCGTAFGVAPAAAVPIMMPKTCSLAIAALVLGLVSFIFGVLTGIPAVILGIIALIKIEKSGGRITGKGLAIAGIITPIFSFALFMVIFMPALLRVKEKALSRTQSLANRMTCGTNLSGLSKAMMIYESDYDRYPTPNKWCDLLIENCEVTPEAFVCKGAPEGPCNYALNKNIARWRPTAQQDIVLLFETYPGWNQVGGPEILTTDNHMGEGCNVAFIGGYVKFVKASDIEYLKWKPD